MPTSQNSQVSSSNLYLGREVTTSVIGWVKSLATIAAVKFNTKKLLASIPFLIVPALSFASETCSIEVNGLLYHHGECRYSKTLSFDRSWSIEIGSEETEDGSLGYWVLLLEDSDGTYQGHWNGAYGVTRAHNRLGEMIEKDDCWLSETSRICLGVPFGDVPTYRILEGDQTPLDNTVEANVNGTRYVIDHDSWEQVGPYEIGPTEGLDGVRDAPGQTKSFDFDLDLDGELDSVTCKYWDRWGSLSCEIRYGGEGQALKMTCKRFAILPEVVADNVGLECSY